MLALRVLKTSIHIYGFNSLRMTKSQPQLTKVFPIVQPKIIITPTPHIQTSFILTFFPLWKTLTKYKYSNFDNIIFTVIYFIEIDYQCNCCFIKQVPVFGPRRENGWWDCHDQKLIIFQLWSLHTFLYFHNPRFLTSRLHVLKMLVKNLMTGPYSPSYSTPHKAEHEWPK